jgi:hypothetical protein
MFVHRIPSFKSLSHIPKMLLCNSIFTFNSFKSLVHLEHRNEMTTLVQTSNRFTRYAKYAFIGCGVVGTMYYAYITGYADVASSSSNSSSKSSSFGKKQKQKSGEELEDEEEDVFEETFVEEIEIDGNGDDDKNDDKNDDMKKSAKSALKPPRSPRSKVVSAETSDEGAKVVDGRTKKKEEKKIKFGFLESKSLSSNGLFKETIEGEDVGAANEQQRIKRAGLNVDGGEVAKERKAVTTMTSTKKPIITALQLVYRNIRRDFMNSKSFDLSAVMATRSLFHFEPFPGCGVWPVKYDDMKIFPSKCSRLIVLSIFDDAPALSASGTAIVSQLSKLMMSFVNADGDDEKSKVRQRPMFVCNRAQYHVTMFFFSRPIEGMMRDEQATFNRAKGGDDDDNFVDRRDSNSSSTLTALDLSTTPPNTPPKTSESSIPKGLGDALLPDRPKPKIKRSVSQNYDRVLSPPTPLGGKLKRSTSGTILDEATKAQEVLRQCDSVELVVDRVVLATSGALLLCFDDVNDSLKNCREALAENAIGTRGVQQTSTAHCTLARFLPDNGDETLSDLELKEIDGLLAKWTKQLRGTKVSCSKAWYVREERFSSVDGEKVRLKFNEKYS